MMDSNYGSVGFKKDAGWEEDSHISWHLGLLRLIDIGGDGHDVV